MFTSVFQFSSELAYFLASPKNGIDLVCQFQGSPSVKHLIESQGIPHTEVGEIRVNGATVSQAYQVQPGDHIEVIQASPMTDNNRDCEPRFLLDNHLGKLAIYLRILGFDSLYSNDFQDEELVKIASQDDRILLTRDRRLLMRRVIRFGYCPRYLEPERQILEVARRYDLYGWIKPFQRCLRCNTPLETVSKRSVLPRLEPLTRRYFDEFHCCPACDQVFWKGSHHSRMLKLVESVMEDASSLRSE